MIAAINTLRLCQFVLIIVYCILLITQVYQTNKTPNRDQSLLADPDIQLQLSNTGLWNLLR